MERLGTIDRALLIGLGALWSVCFVLHVQQLLGGRLAWIPVYVSAAEQASGFPTVSGFWTGSDPAGLASGDRLTAVGGRSLAGAGRLRFAAETYAATDAAGDVALRFERDGHERETRLSLLPVHYPWRTTPVALALAAVGGLVLWRGRGTRLARVLFGACLASSFYWIYFFGASSVAQNMAAIVVFGVAITLACPLIVLTFFLFPSESAPRDRVWQWAPWALAVVGIMVTTWAFGVPLPGPWGAALAGAGNAVFLLALLAILGWDYGHAGPKGRRQLKWVLFGLSAAAVPPLLAAWVTLARPGLWWLFELAQLSWVAVPICVFMAIEFYSAFDIDRLISVTATYTLFLVTGVAGLLTVVPPVAVALQQSANIDPVLSQAGLGLALAAVLVPAARAVRPRLERLLFRERYALEEGAGELRNDIGRCKKGEELIALLGTRLDQLLEPECLAIFGRLGDAFAPVFARGPAVAPAFEGAGRLPTWLELEGTPLRVSRMADAREGQGLLPMERASLAAMSVDVVAPVFRGGELAAFVCLGSKRSGDVYTPTDLALLGGVADKASDRIAGFGAEELREQERLRAEESLRYVPGAIADQVARGASLTPEEREVTVLFVDVRGYTSFAEDRTPEAIFAAIGRHTRAISEIVASHDGFEVDFVGDGLMFAFGATGEAPHKESGAIRAAREIAATMAEGRAGESDEPILPAGIGIATGLACVGVIETDRKNFAVLGNTTNLAARLEGLTRELGAAVLVDRSTRDAADAKLLEEFELHQATQVRGRSEPIDLYALPLPEARQARA